MIAGYRLARSREGGLRAAFLFSEAGRGRPSDRHDGPATRNGPASFHMITMCADPRRDCRHWRRKAPGLRSSRYLSDKSGPGDRHAPASGRLPATRKRSANVTSRALAAASRTRSDLTKPVGPRTSPVPRDKGRSTTRIFPTCGGCCRRPHQMNRTKMRTRAQAITTISGLNS